MRRVNTLFLFLIFVALAIALPANAAIILPTNIGSGFTSLPFVDSDGKNVLFTTTGGASLLKDFALHVGLGVEKGQVPGELGQNKSLTFKYDTPVSNVSIGVVFLYKKGPYDNVNEYIDIKWKGPSGEMLGRLVVSSNGTTALFSLPGFTIVNHDPGELDKAGAWEVLSDNPFDYTEVSFLSACNPGDFCDGPTGPEASMWLIKTEAATGTPIPNVPEPATFALAGASLVALALKLRKP